MQTAEAQTRLRIKVFDFEPKTMSSIDLSKG
jgi:hypothetical protein